MGLVYNRRVKELDDALTLAPERWDPRRILATDGPTLDAFFFQVSKRITPKSIPANALVLDCGHAFEGAVLYKGGPQRPHAKSTKTILEPGDVIISRLRPYLRQVALIDSSLFHHPRTNEPGWCCVVRNSAFCVIDDKMSPCCRDSSLSAVETNPSGLTAAQSGGHHPRIGSELILGLPWPFTDAQEARKERPQSNYMSPRFDSLYFHLQRSRTSSLQPDHTKPFWLGLVPAQTISTHQRIHPVL